MKKLILLLLFMTTACVAPASVPSVDPNVQLAIAQAQLTSTSQAMQIQIVGWTATAQSWTATPSPVPTVTLTPSVTPTPTIDVTMTLAVERMQAEIKDMERESARKDATNTVLAWLPYFLGFVVVAFIGFLAFVLIKRQAIFTVKKDERGDAPLVVDVLKNKVADSDKNPNFESGRPDMKDILWNAFEQWLEKNHGIQPVQPRNTSDRQDRVTERDQVTDLKTRTKVTNAALDRFMKEHAMSQQVPASMPTAITAPVVSDDDINMPLPPWEFIKQWDGTSKPLGFGKAGLITAKAASPHILISGKTGSGKTIFMMRTLTAASLAKGSQVINIGYSNAGYGVFEHHVNFHNVQLPDPRYVIECLAQVYDELKERKALIGGDMVEWEYWPGGQPPRPFLDVMLDELGNMAEDIYTGHGPALTKELWSYISRIANEGRKVGIRFVAALQDPTSKSMDLRFRRNCTLVAFRQGDMDQSRAFLGTAGAEQLSVGHFMASLDSLVVGGGFSPTDIEILEYLANSPVRAAEKPKWIEGVVSGDPLPAREEPLQIIEPTAPESLPSAKPVDEIAEMAERIRSQWSPGMSVRHVAIKLLGFPQNGGAYGPKAEKVIAYLTATTQTATTTQNQPEMGAFEAIPA